MYVLLTGLMCSELFLVYIFAVTGLVCSAILKKLSKKANNLKEQILSVDLEEHSKYTIIYSLFELMYKKFWFLIQRFFSYSYWPHSLKIVIFALRKKNDQTTTYRKHVHIIESTHFFLEMWNILFLSFNVIFYYSWHTLYVVF